MKIYIDSDFKCHISNDGTLREVETAENNGFDFFANKCDEFIEAYRYVPEGETWTREDGEVFNGCMIAPWKDITDVLEVQNAYTQGLVAMYSYELQNAVTLSEMDEAYREGVNAI